MWIWRCFRIWKLLRRSSKSVVGLFVLTKFPLSSIHCELANLKCKIILFDCNRVSEHCRSEGNARQSWKVALRSVCFQFISLSLFYLFTYLLKCIVFCLLHCGLCRFVCVLKMPCEAWTARIYTYVLFIFLRLVYFLVCIRKVVLIIKSTQMALRAAHILIKCSNKVFMFAAKIHASLGLRVKWLWRHRMAVTLTSIFYVSIIIMWCRWCCYFVSILCPEKLLSRVSSV